MADPRGFLEVERVAPPERDPRTRTADHHEIFGTLPADGLREQGRRCMDCGVPFCHQGCPLGNLIPEWNDLVRRGEWQLALERLHATNNFPEFTGLICPAPCEAACVLAINDDPVMIKSIEWGIIERGFREGWVGPKQPLVRTGWSIGVVGSGPAGLAVAEELNAAGHRVVVYERDEGPGGLIRLGVPDFKLEKWIIDRRVALLEEAGIAFEYGVDVGTDLAIDELNARHDAVVLALGSRIEREISLPGRELRRHPHRDDLPAAAQPRRLRRRRAGAHRGGQARDRDRRRRHRRRLRRLGPPRAGDVGDAARHLPAARGQEVPRADHLAGLPEAALVDLRARRGRRAVLVVQRDRVRGRRRARARAGGRQGRPAAGLRADGRDPRAARRPRADRDRLHRRRARARRPARRRRR